MDYPTNNPVKLDAAVIEMAPNGSFIKVVFDIESLGEVILYPYGQSTGLLVDKAKCTSVTNEKARCFKVV